MSADKRIKKPTPLPPYSNDEGQSHKGIAIKSIEQTNVPLQEAFFQPTIGPMQ
jgi:hypothetical protein